MVGDHGPAGLVEGELQHGERQGTPRDEDPSLAA
jgi:hypothetical protein